MTGTIFKKRDQARTQLQQALKNLDETGKGQETIQHLTGVLEDLNAKCAEAEKAKNLVGVGLRRKTEAEKPAKTIGEHYVKTALGKVRQDIGVYQKALSVTTPEFKAATDTHVSTTEPTHLAPVLIDRNIVRPYDYPLTIADWLGSGTMSEKTLVYFVEKTTSAVEGNITFVAENTKKPQLHFAGYEEVTETLKKIAGYIKISTEMLEDEDFIVTELNNRLLRQLVYFEEAELLKGDGSSNNIKGILNRDNVQTGTYTGYDDLADEIFKACTKIQNATGLVPDGVLMNPEDYQELRLKKDQNGQYYAGGPFQGAYGNGTIMQNPPLWGKKTIITPAIEKGTILVGAGKDAATVYRKGGITINTAFQNEDDFVNNRATILAEERLALAVRVPSAFCKLTKS